MPSEGQCTRAVTVPGSIFNDFLLIGCLLNPAASGCPGTFITRSSGWRSSVSGGFFSPLARRASCGDLGSRGTNAGWPPGQKSMLCEPQGS